MPYADLCFSAASLLTSKRPRCPQCGGEMWLVRLVTVGPQMSERTFECPACEMFPAEKVDVKQEA
jgi:hypothetical protein